MRCRDHPLDCAAGHILPKLGDVATIREGQWHGHCPAHDDQRASLSFSIGTKGARFVWACFAGCDPTAVRAALIVRLGADPDASAATPTGSRPAAASAAS